MFHRHDLNVISENVRHTAGLLALVRAHLDSRRSVLFGRLGRGIYLHLVKEQAELFHGLLRNVLGGGTELLLPNHVQPLHQPLVLPLQLGNIVLLFVKLLVFRA